MVIVQAAARGSGEFLYQKRVTTTQIYAEISVRNMG